MWLIGMMGSGKTTVGKKAAGRVGVPFYDTDAIVVEMAKMSIRLIWDSVGEAGFRELERRAVATVPDSEFIAAAGGGAVMDADSREQIRSGGPVVWLRGDPLVLAERLEDGDARPLLEGDGPTRETLSAILEQRADAYADLATDVIDTDGRQVEDVVSEVVGMWGR